MSATQERASSARELPEEALLRQARQELQRGQPMRAAQVAQQLLAQPLSVGDKGEIWCEAHYILAVCQRLLGNHDDALETLENLLNRHPDYARAYQEWGHNQRSNDRDAAITAYEQAVALNPALPASWDNLLRLYSEAGDQERARVAREQCARWADTPRELISVASMTYEGRLYKAEKLCRSYLQRQPHHPEAMRLLADIGVRLNVYDDAEFLLESCLELHPEFQRARQDYVNVLLRRQQYHRAREQAQRLREGEPGHPATEMAFASASTALGDNRTALAVLDALLDEHPRVAGVHLQRGHVLKTEGRAEDAIAAYRQAYTRQPDCGDAYWSLANLKVYRFTDAEIERMRRAESASRTLPEDRWHLCFALGKALEDRADYAASFAYYERGNALKRRRSHFRATTFEQSVGRQIEVCDKALFEKHAGHGCPSPEPIFIVGLPRAGSTLLEQILASHSQVEGTRELPHVLAMAHRLNGRRWVDHEQRYPGILTELSAEQLRELGDQYLEETRVHRSSAPFFIDKMPNNFRHIGLIHLMLPNARIIDARREPMACCFSAYKQLFAEGQEFSYNLEDLGRYYCGYVELMAHWRHVLPGCILQVRYEEVVADLEGQVKRLLDFCGLPFEAACLDFHRTRRAVRTASSEQVRQPLYREGLDSWRGFEPYLEPLKVALGPLCGEYDRVQE